MIKVLIILIVLILSGIFAYLASANKKDGPTPTVVPGPSSEEVVSAATENAGDIETIPTEPEDPGTCEITGTWAMVGTCNADGTAKYIQTYKESKPGACPSSVKADFKVCCYQKGDWKDITECKPTGKKTQEQTTINCAENFKTREVECEYVGPWNKVGGCTSEGKQYYTRSTVNSSESTSKSEGCCYISPWGGWGSWGVCDGSNRYRERSRDVVNCASDVPKTEKGSQTCNHCVGDFFEISRRDGCFFTKNKIYIDQEYRHTKPATNGGNVCPFEHGVKLSKSIDGGNADCSWP
jgi:hypothetical protein